jgi:transposase InsO family protein
MEVLQGAQIIEVAARYGVSRQSVHAWLDRYREGGLAGLVTRSSRPASCPHQTDVEIEQRICELRRAHPRWGPRRLGFELERRGVQQPPSRATLYRILVRNGLLEPKTRKKRRSEYLRWERAVPMELWQMDIVGGVILADGPEAKVVTGVDDHSRFCVIAAVVARPTGRAVCAAFATALRAFGIPEEVLTDNGKQFTGRFGRPRGGEVLFDRICRENGIVHRLTKPRSPTTTGKVERFHQTLQGECLDGKVFATLADAQAAVDLWVVEYNHDRPHQALDMATPAKRFNEGRQEREDADDGLALRLPPGLEPTPPLPAPAPADPVGFVVDAQTAPVAVEVDRVVPTSGNLDVHGQQIWLGPTRAGLPIVVWADTNHVHVLTGDGTRVKSCPSRLSSKDLARLLADGGRPARPSPTSPAIAGGTAVEVDRMVNAVGSVSLAGRVVCAGSALAGQRVTLRVDGRLVQVLDADRHLLRTLTSPVPAGTHIRDGRPAGPPAQPSPNAVTVRRVVSIQGALQVAGQKIQVGRVHARKIVDVTLDETTVTIHHDGELLTAVPRRSTTEVNRIKNSEYLTTKKIV